MLTADRIRYLLDRLNVELAQENVRGEIFLAGGAVMCLVFHAREATKDVDALLVPAGLIREARQQSGSTGRSSGRLASQAGRFDVYAELSHLRIFAPHPEYLLAMKCLAMRLGEELQDRSDVAFLLKILKIERLEDAEEVLQRYYPLERYPAKARYVLEELTADV